MPTIHLIRPLPETHRYDFVSACQCMNRRNASLSQIADETGAPVYEIYRILNCDSDDE